MTIKWLILSLAYLCIVQGQFPCTTPDFKRGDCRRIDTCEPLNKLIPESGFVHTEDLIFVRKSKCGFDQSAGKAKVCCPIVQNSCLTPENKTGQCVDIYDCKHIMNGLSLPAVTQQYKDYVNSLRCQGDTSFKVCCGPPSDPVLAPTLPSTLASTLAPTMAPTSTPPLGPHYARARNSCTLNAQPPVPASKCCGNSGPMPRVFGGNETKIYQYPWLALIEYEKEYTLKLLCGGVLISGRYVMTAGHCVVGRVLKIGEPKNVRLGEYDISNEGKDCVEVDGGEPGENECTLDPVIIRIERIIAHPEFDPIHPLRRNDIAMLRLASIPQYTRFVRPICLPTTDITANFPRGGNLYVAGWGAVSDKISYSNVKLHVDLPYKTLEVCQQAYDRRKTSLWDHQVCAGGDLGKDSCKGDSGGPLMYHSGSRFELIGIVSFGPVPCGQLNVPGVYTKVFEYISWIHNNIEP